MMKITSKPACLLALISVILPVLAENPKKEPAIEELKQCAVAFEKAEERLKAAKIYEQLAEKDETSRTVLANRLATLYAQEGCSEKALHWASIAATQNPDPQAYMAGIYSMLGDDQSAIHILEQELAKKNDPHRTMTLSCQLTTIYENINELEKAELTMQTAVAKLQGTSIEAEAKKQLNAFREKHIHS